MAESKIQRLNRLDLDEVCEMIADGASLAQSGLNLIGVAMSSGSSCTRMRNIGRLTWQLYKSEDSITPI